MKVSRLCSGQIFSFFKSKFSNFFDTEKKYRRFFLAFIFFMVLAGLIFPSGSAKAEGWGDSIAGVILDIMYPIIYLIFLVFFEVAYMIAWIGASIISMSLNPYILTTVLSSPNIYQGWQIFRDIANLLYILILLLVALGTIFRSDTYNAKKLLPKLIIVAFLLNFSMMITEIVVDFGNILMYGILKMMCPPDSGTCFQDFFAPLMRSVDYLNETYTLSSLLNVDAQSAVGLVIATIYTFVYGLVLIALGVFLLVRVAVLAVLIILSPLAFFGTVAPGLKKVSDEWWDKVLSYSLFGPIFALLLYVAGLMAQTTFVVNNPAITANPNLGSMGTLFGVIITNIIPMVFLLAIIPITKGMGMIGSNMIMNSTVGFGVGAAAFAGSYLGGKADRWLARGAQSERKGVMGGLRRFSSNLSPGAWKRAWKAKKSIEEQDYSVASGRQLNKFDHPITSTMDPLRKEKGERRVDYEAREKKRNAAVELKEMEVKDIDEMITKLEKAIKEKDGYLAAEIMRGIAALGSTDDALDRISDRHDHTAVDFNAVMNDKIKPLIGEEEASKLSREIGKLEEKDGTYIYQGHGMYDDKTDRYSMLNMIDKKEKDEKGNIKYIINEDAQAKQIDTMLGRWDSSPERGRMSKVSKTTFADKEGNPTVQGAAILAQMQGQEAQKKTSNMKPKAAKAAYAAMVEKDSNKIIFEHDVFIKKAMEKDDKGQIKYKNLSKIGGADKVKENKEVAQAILDKIKTTFYKKEAVPRGEKRTRSAVRQEVTTEIESEAEEEEAAVEEEEQQGQ